ncbi:DUF3999 domain-containing protein [Alloalcanivorax sp. C16-2]|uniref:DUF3999 domain-containing protein n=1 Tax=Alloalcanivorax sp. C16-2 TaxID=3390052 RepID=UPI00397046F3
MRGRFVGLVMLALGLAETVMAAPVPEDFAEGIPLETSAPASAYRLPLPETVYALSTRDDLGDLRVFNRDGQVVQHALCTPPATSTVTARPLPVHGLPAGRADQAAGAGLSIETADGLRMRWREAPSQAPEPASGSFEYILDARDLDTELTGVRLDWHWRSPEGRAELPIRVDASDDLDQWRTVVSRSTLLRVQDDTLEVATVTLPQRRYRFLRLIPLDERARDWLRGASALPRPDAGDGPALDWVAAARMGEPDADGALRFHAERPLTARQWRLRLPGPNRVLRVELSSRADAEDSWRRRFQSTVASGPDNPVTGTQPTGSTTSPADRFWRLRILSGAESLGPEPVILELGYVPLDLAFLAQGEGPFLLAYGSGTAPPAQVIDCARFGEAAAARVRPARVLGGDAALRPAPEPLPTRRIVLWGILLLGAALVVVMALGLLRKMRD